MQAMHSNLSPKVGRAAHFSQFAHTAFVFHTRPGAQGFHQSPILAPARSVRCFLFLSALSRDFLHCRQQCSAQAVFEYKSFLLKSQHPNTSVLMFLRFGFPVLRKVEAASTYPGRFAVYWRATRIVCFSVSKSNNFCLCIRVFNKNMDQPILNILFKSILNIDNFFHTTQI